MPSYFARVPVPSRRVLMAIGVGVVLLVGVVMLGRRFDFAAVHAWTERVNGFAVFAAMALLPLVGFPISVLHAAAGIKFGLGWGLVLAALALVVHLVLSFALVRLLPGFFAKRLDFLRRRLPPTTHRAATFFTLLMPAAPYFAQNYLVPLIGVPFSMFFAIGFPLHLVRSVISLYVGDMSAHPTPGRIAFVAGYAVVVTLAWGWAFRRLRAQLRAQPKAAGDPKPRASRRSAVPRSAGE